MTPAATKKMRQLATALTAQDLRALAIERKMPEGGQSAAPSLINALIANHHDALLDRLKLRINEMAKEIAT